MNYLVTAFLFLMCICAQAGAQIIPADTVAAVVNVETDNNKVKFKSELRPLRPIAGAPAPFYTYFWEFGDGNFSFEKEPMYIYNKQGQYDVRLFATNNYDDGKPPPTKPTRITIQELNQSTKLATVSSPLFKLENTVILKTNRMPRPNEELTLIVGYRNKNEWNIPNLNGKLAILYNDKEFKQNNFTFEGVRSYHGEQKILLTDAFAYIAAPKIEDDWKQRGSAGSTEQLVPSTFKEKKALFRNNLAWNVTNIKQGEERFMFISLKTTAEMVQDTNATLSITAVFMPDHPFAQEDVFDLKLQVVASHDPNKMALENRRMSYRFTGKKRELTYKVRFQNTGEGPAKKVVIDVNAPKALDLTTLKIIGTQPQCIPCDSAYSGQSCLATVVKNDSVRFTFNNIYLPGVKQKGVNDVDSTMGYIEYKVRFAKKPGKLPFNSQATIIFDKNPPIYTNRSRGSFKPGLSPGIVVAYGSQLNQSKNIPIGKNNFSFGLTVSPFSPYRKYLQAEIYVSTFTETEIFLGRTAGVGDTIINKQGYKIDYREAFKNTKTVSIDLVPIQLRYNINSFIGVGAGALVSANLSTVVKNRQNISLIGPQGTSEPLIIETKTLLTERFNSWRTTLFADVQIGKVRKGPVLGFRYFYPLTQSDGRLSMYLGYRL